MTSVFPTKTFPNHWSLVTGLHPESSGIVHNTMYVQGLGGWFHESRNEPQWWLGEPIWSTLKRRKGYRITCVFLPGSEIRSSSFLSPDVFDKFDEDDPYESRVRRALKRIHGRGEMPGGYGADFVCMYFNGVDTAGHRSGPESDEVSEEISRVDAAIGLLMDGLGSFLNSAKIVVVSDHGMARIPYESKISLDDILPKGAVQDIAVSPVGFFIPVNMSEEQVYKKLVGNLDRSKVSVWKKEDLPERYHIKNSDRVPPLVTLTNKDSWLEYSHQSVFIEKQLVQSGGTLRRGAKSAASHGWDNQDDDMKAIFIARGPAFKSNGSVLDSMSAVDVYNCICYAMSDDPMPNNGSGETAAKSLKSFVNY